MSNGGRIVTPTFSIEPFMGSNPISEAIPGGSDALDFYLDMSTASVARGKIETYLREGKPIPKGWVPEGFGALRLDDEGILTFDVPLLPLGGDGPESGGHKGYALSLMVELLCSVLVGQANPATGHFLGAIKIESFRKLSLVHRQIAETFAEIRNLKRAAGQQKIYIPGELEALAEKENRQLGIPVTAATLEQMRRLDRMMTLGFNF
jgi:LDH2 family malate/lactate/ureidoglycolate dehydrogenase